MLGLCRCWGIAVGRAGARRVRRWGRVAQGMTGSVECHFSSPRPNRFHRKLPSCSCLPSAAVVGSVFRGCHFVAAWWPCGRLQAEGQPRPCGPSAVPPGPSRVPVARAGPGAPCGRRGSGVHRQKDEGAVLRRVIALPSVRVFVGPGPSGQFPADQPSWRGKGFLAATDPNAPQMDPIMDEWHWESQKRARPLKDMGACRGVQKGMRCACARWGRVVPSSGHWSVRDIFVVKVASK